jgi:hypothetical protein
MEVDAAALAAHTFEYDSTALDKPLVDFLQKFYTFSDDKTRAADWADCFTENAVMKKASTDVVGREGTLRSHLILKCLITF